MTSDRERKISSRIGRCGQAAHDKEEIERLIVADLRTFAGCHRARAVVVAQVVDHSSAATWTVSRFHTGGSDGEACDRALQHIVPLFQRVNDLVQKH
jgi:hypothetical protein